MQINVTPEQHAEIERRIAATTDTLKEPMTPEQYVERLLTATLTPRGGEAAPSGY